MRIGLIGGSFPRHLHIGAWHLTQTAESACFDGGRSEWHEAQLSPAVMWLSIRKPWPAPGAVAGAGAGICAATVNSAAWLMP